MARQIIIGMERWQFVGFVEREGDQLVITEAKNIRRWGTVSGLGQLAKQGPQAETVLDDYGTVRIHVLAVVASLECDESAWKAVAKEKR